MTEVCGDELVNETSEFMTKVNKLKTVYGALVDKMHPILSQVVIILILDSVQIIIIFNKLRT